MSCKCEVIVNAACPRRAGFAELMEYVKAEMSDIAVVDNSEYCGFAGGAYVCTDFGTYIDVMLNFEGELGKRYPRTFWIRITAEEND